uniref:adenine phosphoribosyltransferase n=1 Tax=viral metagenome TaxID=1070528 RepID=A0A6C0CIU1_9ZZZZ
MPLNFQVVLCSKSDLKSRALKKALEVRSSTNKDLKCDFTIHTVEIQDKSIPNQPLGYDGGLRAAESRIEWVEHNRPELLKSKDPVIVVAIENYITPPTNKRTAMDSCLTIMKLVLSQGNNVSWKIPQKSKRNVWDNVYVPLEYYNEAVQKSRFGGGGNYTDLGMEFTVGQIIHEHHPQIPSNNWMPWIESSKKGEIVKVLDALPPDHTKLANDRYVQIYDSVYGCLLNKNFFIHAYLSNLIQYHENFPKKGILFANVMPLFHTKGAYNLLISYLADLIRTNLGVNGKTFDKFVSLESRGFTLGGGLAVKFKKDVVHIRKAGKLPGETYTASYKKEYGEDTFEMMADTFSGDGSSEPSKVILVDDLIATGGSLKAARDLVEKAGAVVVGVIVLKCIPELLEEAKDLIGRDVELCVSTF